MNTKHLRHIALVLLCYMLCSCEITTVKGNWKSTDENGIVVKRIFNDDSFTMQMFYLDTLFHKTQGTWIQKGDTIDLFRNANNKESRFIIKQMSQDKMTLQAYQDHEASAFCVYDRQYSTNDPIERFMEVLKLKWGIFPVSALQVVCGILTLAFLCMLLYLMAQPIIAIFDSIRDFFNNKKEE